MVVNVFDELEVEVVEVGSEFELGTLPVSRVDLRRELSPEPVSLVDEGIEEEVVEFDVFTFFDLVFVEVRVAVFRPDSDLLETE